MTRTRVPTAVLAIALAAGAAGGARASEGMWTFDNFPIAAANRALGTNIDQAWLDRVRLASVRIGGASGGLVSPEGLIFTNEHVVSGCVENLSTLQQNYSETGFTPSSRAGERRCPGMTAEILTDISDVTQRMQAAGRGLEGEAFTRARDAEAGRIETEGCRGDATRRCQVVTLYRGGQFKLYTAPRPSAATSTISASRASRSTARSCGSTRTTGRSRPQTTCAGTRRRRAPTGRCSCPEAPAPPSGCSPRRSSAPSPTSPCRSSNCWAASCAAG